MNPLDRLQELRIYHAFLSLPSSRFPTTPFHLNPWTKINHPHWFALLRSEVLAAVSYLEGETDRPHPRQHTGALIAVLRDLKPHLQKP